MDDDKEYWFMRWLVATDEYPGYGSDYPDTLLETAEELRNSDTEVGAAMESFRDETLGALTRTDTKKYRETAEMVDRIEKEVGSDEDIDDLAFAAEAVGRTTKALDSIPSNDRRYAQEKTRELIREDGEDALPDVLKFWDRLGTEGSLVAEREVVRDETDRLLETETDAARVSAFLQEFERRLGNKRVGRAGRSLESVTEVILDEFGIENTGAPEVLRSGFEVDNLVPCADGGRIGISCKRTLRERWKQSSGFDMSTLDEHSVREVWHVVTYESDISENKARAMGEARGRIYLRDGSPTYESLSRSDVSDFVYPLSDFVSDLRGETGS
jgi:hypothetical protein